MSGTHDIAITTTPFFHFVYLLSLPRIYFVFQQVRYGILPNTSSQFWYEHFQTAYLSLTSGDSKSRPTIETKAKLEREHRVSMYYDGLPQIVHY